jgi:hypothetical protein
MAERLVLPNRITVSMHQNTARTLTMKRTRIYAGVSWLLVRKPWTKYAYTTVSTPAI